MENSSEGREPTNGREKLPTLEQLLRAYGRRERLRQGLPPIPEPTPEEIRQLAEEIIARCDRDGTREDPRK